MNLRSVGRGEVLIGFRAKCQRYHQENVNIRVDECGSGSRLRDQVFLR